MKTDDDDLAWKREFDRVEAKQNQRKSKREGWELKESEFNPITIIPFGDTYEIKDDNNESSN